MKNEIQLKDKQRFEREMEEIKDKYPEIRQLEELDKKLRHKPVTLYCLGCGSVISKSFTGGLWSYTHPCNFEEARKNWDNENFKNIICVVFGSKERGVMFPSSLVGGYKSYARCKECKSEEEHIKRVLGGLGLAQEFKSEDKELIELRRKAIMMVRVYASKDYGLKVMQEYPEEFKEVCA